MALSGAAFGLMPVLAVWAYAAGVSVLTVLSWRFVVSALVLGAAAVLAGQVQRYPRRDVIAVLALGAVLYTAQSSLYFVAVGRISPAVAVLLLYLYPAIVAAATFIRDRVPPSPALLIALALSFGGVVLAAGGPSGALDLVGVACAVGAAVTYATYVMAGDRIGSRVPPLLSSAGVTGSAAVVFVVVGAVSGHLDVAPPRAAWGPILGLALVCGAFAIGSFLAGVPMIGAPRASILSTLEPAIGVLAAAALLGQSLSPAQWLGVTLVLAGALLSAFTHPAAGRGRVLPT